VDGQFTRDLASADDRGVGRADEAAAGGVPEADARDAHAGTLPGVQGHARGEVAVQDDPYATVLPNATGPLDDIANTLLARARPAGELADDTALLLVMVP
jgi:hypothetical protein